MSIVLPPSYPDALRDHASRLRPLERGGSIWIYVGTLGVDGVDALLTPDSPPFINGTNAGGTLPPVSFTRYSGWIHLRGAYTSVLANDALFQLPTGYRPPYDQPLIIPNGDGNGFANALVDTLGFVYHLNP